MAEQELKSPDARIAEDEYNGIVKSYTSGGTNAMRQYILTRLNRWKSTKINIAVTGNAGVGKSSLINALRNVKAGDIGAAKVGLIEKTKEATPYEFPKNENVILWDLPGVGTEEFPRETYNVRMKLDRYDAYIIVSAERFTENDAWLIRNAFSKCYYIVRTKMDHAVTEEERNNNLTETQTLQKIRESCKRMLSPEEHVYLISTRQTHLYDFDELAVALDSTANRSRNDALLYILSTVGKYLIEAKKEELKCGITEMAIGSAVAGFVPIPGLEILVDSVILSIAVKFYIEKFEMNEESLMNLSAEIGEPLSEIQNRLETSKLDISFLGLAHYFGNNDRSSTFQKVAKYLLPVVGSFISSRKSFVACESCVSDLLDITSQDGLKIMQMRMKKYIE